MKSKVLDIRWIAEKTQKLVFLLTGRVRMKQSSRIQTKINYNYIPLETTITHKVGAWMYHDGGCDFD